MAMYTLFGALAGALLLSGVAFAADEVPARSTQAERMTRCNAEARDKKLAGDERRHFMSECLKGHTSSAEGMAQAGKASPRKSVAGESRGSQSEKMKACNQEATGKNLHGDERRQFMSDCLKADRKS
jgi:hypothetical protein